MLTTVLQKEAKQLWSDKIFLLIALIQPIIFVIMFGSSFQGGDINHLKTIVIDKDNTDFSKYVVDSINNSEFFMVVEYSDSLENSLEKLNKSEVRAVILIPLDFEKNINNRTVGSIKVYLDSSNFLTFSSLNGAKIGIAKNSLKNVTSDILGNLENEKKLGKEKIERVKEIFDSIDTETNNLDKDLEELKNESLKINTSKIRNSIKDLKDSLVEQRDSINSVIASLDRLNSSISSIKAFNQTEEAKKAMILNQTSQMMAGFVQSHLEIISSIDELNEISIPDMNNKTSEKIEQRLDKVKQQFEQAEIISKNINLDFKNLDKNFLSEPIKIEQTAIHGPIKYFDYLGAGVLSLIVFFVCLMAPALNIISEKEENTLYRLATTPASSLTVFFGKFIVFISFGFVEMIYTLLLAIFLYDLRITGSVYSVVFILGLLACCSISLGLFISSKVKTMQQALVIVPIIVIPSFLISNAFFPPDIMENFMNYISYMTPMTYSNHALNAIMIKGFGLKDVTRDILALLAFTIVPLILFIISYRRLRY